MLKVSDLTFSYKKTPVLSNISFQVNQGENLGIIGESGSGKSTLLKLIYGEYDLHKGSIFWKDTQILGPKFNLVIGYDFIKQVTQEFNLMPFTTVEENIAKDLSRFYPDASQKRVNELLEVIELQAYAKIKVKNLSGGQKQRVALARALAKEPEIILLDEPFSHIDNFKKQSLRRNVFKYLKENNITCIVATHDKDDVLGFADYMMVIHNSKIIRTGHPETLYNNPKTPLVASFFDEFSIIDNEIYYAHQLQILENASKKAMVLGCYFNGNNWLIEAVNNNNNNKLHIYHTDKVIKGEIIHFKIINSHK